MTDLRQAAQQALEALEGVLDDSPKVLDASISGGLYEVVQCRDAITALREALAQPEQEPVAMLFGSLPVYDTAAAQRPWQGLTDEEIESAISDGFARGLDDGNVSNRAVIKYVRGIEAKLKEHNT